VPQHLPGRRRSRWAPRACGSCSSGLRCRKSARLARQGQTMTSSSVAFAVRCVRGGRRPRAVGAVTAATRRSHCSMGAGPCGTHFPPEGDVQAAATDGAGPHAFDAMAGPCTKIGTSSDKTSGAATQGGARLQPAAGKASCADKERAEERPHWARQRNDRDGCCRNEAESGP
jgi:hypothetical protein